MVVTDEALPEMPARPNLHDSVQAALRDYILHNDLRAGDGLPSEGELARRLGVSRNSVREAVKALSSLGILETRRGLGVFVKEFSLTSLIDNLPFSLLFDYDELSDLFEVRFMLEDALIPRALENMTADTKAELRAIVDEMHARAARGESVLDEDRRFHHTLIRDAGNAVAPKLQDAFWHTATMAIAHRKEGVGQDDPGAIALQHEQLIDAIDKGDLATVREALTSHYTAKPWHATYRKPSFP